MAKGPRIRKGTAAARPQSAIEDDPLESDVLSQARQVYEPLRLADQLLRSGMVSPEELEAVTEKWPQARTVTSSYAQWKLKQRIALLEPLALFEFVCSGSAATKAEEVTCRSMATRLAKVRLTVAVENAQTSAASNPGSSACFLNDYLTVCEVQTLVFVAHPEPTETLKRCVAFLNLFRRDTVRGLLQLVAPVIGVLYMAEEDPDLRDATAVEDEETFVMSELAGLSRNEVSTALEDAAEIDQLLGFAPLLAGSSQPESRKSLRHVDDVSGNAGDSSSQTNGSSIDLVRGEPKAGSAEAESALVHFSRSRKDLLGILERLAQTDTHFGTAIFGPADTTALDLKLKVIGSTSARTGEWLEGLSVAAAGPFPQSTGGEKVSAKQAMISHKCSPIPSSSSSSSSLSSSADAEFTEVQLPWSAGGREVRREGISSAESILAVALRASNNGARPLFTWSTKLIDVVPVYEAAELLNRIDHQRQLPRHAKTFVGVKGSFKLYIANQDAPLVFVNAYPLFVRWINLSEITSVGSKRGQAHLAKNLFNSNLIHPLLPRTSTPPQSTIKVAACLGRDGKAPSTCLTKDPKLRKCMADIAQEAHLVDFLREVADIAKREKGGQVEFDEGHFSPRAGTIAAWLSSASLHNNAKPPSNLTSSSSAGKGKGIEPLRFVYDTRTGSRADSVPEKKVEISDEAWALWRSLLSRVGLPTKTATEEKENGPPPAKRRRGEGDESALERRPLSQIQIQ